MPISREDYVDKYHNKLVEGYDFTYDISEKEVTEETDYKSV